MIYYLILFFILLLAGLAYFIKNAAARFLLYSLIVIFFIFFSGLRYETGFDYDNYLRVYEDVKSYGNSLEIEPLVGLLMAFCAKTYIGYIGFILLMAALGVTIKAKFFWQYSLFPFISFVLYFSRLFLYLDMGQIRQGVAAGVVLWSFIYIKEGNLKKYTYLFLAAIFIHVSSLLFYPVYFIAKKKIRPAILIALLIITIPIAMFDVKNLLMNYLTNFMPAFVAEKLLYYGTTEAEEVIGLSYSLFLRISLILMLILLYPKQVYENENCLIAFNIYYWGVIVYLVFNSLPQLGQRGSIYFQQFELLLFPYLLYFSKSRLVNASMILFIIIYCAAGVSSTINSQDDSYIPYQTIFISRE